jgi:hypothetical protein
MGDKDSAFKPFTSWKSRTPTLDDLRERMAVLIRDMPRARSRRRLSRQPSLNRADIYCPCCTRLPRNRGSVGSRREGLTLAADRRQPFGWPMTRNNARIIAKYLREAGWSEVTALRQELAASKARVQEMGRHNATEAGYGVPRARMRRFIGSTRNWAGCCAHE